VFRDRERADGRKVLLIHSRTHSLTHTLTHTHTTNDAIVCSVDKERLGTTAQKQLKKSLFVHMIRNDLTDNTTIPQYSCC
jgi:hypothetical protein